MKKTVITALATTIAAGVLLAPSADAATGIYKNCKTFNTKYPTGVARSVTEAEAAVARRMVVPTVNRKVYAKARKANKRLGSPADGVLCEVKAPVTPPSAPRDVTSSLGATRAAYLQWNNPESDGNADITAFIVRGPGSITVNGNKATVSGLEPDTEYTFEVVAVNAAGEGEVAMFTVRTKAEAVATPAPTAAAPSATRYANCTAARAAGVTPIRRDTNPTLYAANRHLDRDGDGIACE